MGDLRELYQEVILDHGRHPRNFGNLQGANCHQEGFNPLCGDKIIIHAEVVKETIINVSFEGCGCAISMASASLMTEALKGKLISEFKTLSDCFHQLLTQSMSLNSITEKSLGKLTVLSGVAEFPARVKCATLAWHTCKAALEKNDKPISTE